MHPKEEAKIFYNKNFYKTDKIANGQYHKGSVNSASSFLDTFILLSLRAYAALN